MHVWVHVCNAFVYPHWRAYVYNVSNVYVNHVMDAMHVVRAMRVTYAMVMIHALHGAGDMCNEVFVVRVLHVTHLMRDM